jgi:SAM-dependent methyltransferase
MIFSSRSANVSTLKEANPIKQKNTRPKLQDYVSLLLTLLAKVNKVKLRNADEQSLEMREFYERFFSEKDLLSLEQDERRVVRRNTIREFLDSHVKRSGCFLDVGCGFGEVLLGIPPQWRLYGMDYSDYNVEAARAILKERAIIKQGSIYEIPFENSSMDVCCCVEVLEHIKDEERGLKEIYRVLKHGGILILSVPYTYYWPQYKSRMGHYRHYTRESLGSLLKQNSFFNLVYLPNYPHWNLKYSRQYVLTRILCLTIGRVMNHRDVFQFTWPWANEPRMFSIKRKLKPTFECDKELDYKHGEFSTFVAAWKKM